MSLDYLTPIEAKLQRVRTKRLELSSNISSWSKKYPLRGICELKEKRHGFRLILSDFKEPEEITKWGIEAAECIYNLRSSLDNLAFSFARLKNDPPQNPRKIYFPIFTDEKSYRSKTKGMLNQIDDPIATMIEKIQPFQRNHPKVEGTPKDDPLVLLNKLSNRDKHHIPLAVKISQKEIQHTTQVQYYTSEDASKNVPPKATIWAGELKPGVVLMDFKSNTPIKSVDGKFDFEAIITVDNEGNTRSITDTISYLEWYTNLVFDQFKPFFN